MRDPITGKEIPVAGQVGALPTASAPPPSGSNIANVTGAPLSQNTANEPQGVGAVPTQAQGGEGGKGAQTRGFDPTPDRGPPDQVIPNGMRTDYAGMRKTGEAAGEAIENTRKNSNGQSNMQGVELNKQLEANGVPVKKSFGQLKDEIEKALRRNVEDKKMTEAQAKKERKGWRKVFNVIHEDEMGLFLIDFGMRAMMAGEEMGSMGALGAAGSGALGALQGQRQTAKDEDMAISSQAHEMAVGQMGAEADQQRADAATVTAEAKKTSAERSGDYAGEKVWAEAFYTSLGWSREEIAQVFSGADTYEQIFDKSLTELRKRQAKAAEDNKMGIASLATKIKNMDGKMVPLSGVSDEELAELAGRAADAAIKIRGQRRKDSNSSKDLSRALAGSQEN